MLLAEVDAGLDEEEGSVEVEEALQPVIAQELGFPQ